MNKSVVIVPLGRFSPPHKEHENLVNAVLKLAKKTHSDAKIFVSRTVDKKKNPLTPQEKIKYLNKMFPGHKGLFDMPPANNPTMIGSLAELSGKYDTVHIVLGDDRVAATETLVNKYNGKDFTFDKIVVHSRHSIISTRVGDADGVHASDIRKWAQQGDFAKVRESMSNHLSDADVKEIMHLIQSRLGALKETTLDDMFSLYITEEDNEATLVMPSQSEIKKDLDDMSNDDLDLEDSDVLMLDIIVGDEEGEEKKKDDEMHEATVMSLSTRQKHAQRMKSLATRFARLRKIKAKQMPANQRLMMRARKAALMTYRMRAVGSKHLDYNALSKSQRIVVDRALIKRFGKKLKAGVDALARKILPMIRKKAQENVKKARDIKEYVDYPFPKQKKEVPDQKKDNPLNVDPLKLTINTIDPTQDDRTAPDPTTAHLNRNKKMRFKNVLNTEGRKSAADKDARDAGDTNIIYQMRKTINSRGEHETVFADGHKSHISVNDAKRMIAKFEALRMPADKHNFTIAAGKSLQSFRSVMSHGIPKDKPKISLGGRQFNEFYLGIGRTRTVSPYDRDEPPGVRNVGEVAKDENRPTDPNRSRPLSQKLDLLLRLGLSDQEELQKYRSALRSSKKHALQSPSMREALANLLDKLIDLTTKDPATYSRVRYNVVNKEANALLRKASDSGVPVEIIYEVFTRGFEVNNNMNEAFGRVNSFIAGGKAAKMDSDLSEKVKAPTGGLKDACWSGYTAVGMKMKNGRKVPNCVPKEETTTEAKSNWDKQARFAKYDTISSRGSQKKAYVDRNYTPMKTDLAKDADAIRNAFLAKGGLIQKIEPGKKTIKSYVKPKKYMTPNQASRVTEGTEGAKGSNGLKKLSDYYKKNKSIVKADESYTGSEPVSKDKNDPKNRFVGTKTIVQNYAAATPGQNMISPVGQIDQAAFSPMRESHDLNESFAAGFELAPFARDYGIRVQSSYSHSPDVQEQLDAMEATYKGKTVPLNKPMKGDVKKSKVYVDPDGDGKAKKVNFGDKKLSIKKDQPARKRSYCARSGGQGNLTNKSSANYWSRRAWDC